MDTVHFPAQYSTSDWYLPYVIQAPGLVSAWNAPDDEVVIGISPDFASWDDYGQRRMAFPPAAVRPAPFWQASSNDGSGVVSLAAPATVNILVPARVISSFGIGTVNVGVKFRRFSDGREQTLLVGRLPIVNGVI